MAIDQAELYIFMIMAYRCLTWSAFAGILFVLTGCVQSPLIYQNTIRPFTNDFEDTSVGSKKCTVKSYKLRVPVANYNVTAEWDVNTVVKAARSAGITNICHADERILSVLSIYRRKTLIVYGD